MTRPPAATAVRVAAFILLAVAATGCCDDDASPTSPTPTTPTIAEPSISKDFVTTLGVGSSSFYSFSVTQNGP